MLHPHFLLFGQLFLDVVCIFKESHLHAILRLMVSQAWARTNSIVWQCSTEWPAPNLQCVCHVNLVNFVHAASCNKAAVIHCQCQSHRVDLSKLTAESQAHEDTQIDLNSIGATQFTAICMTSWWSHRSQYNSMTTLSPCVFLLSFDHQIKGGGDEENSSPLNVRQSEPGRFSLQSD